MVKKCTKKQDSGVSALIQETKPNYASLDKTPVDIEYPQYGLFTFPDLKVGIKYGEKKFVIFYFDTEDEYKLVVDKLGVSSPHIKEHPIMNSEKLVEILSG